MRGLLAFVLLVTSSTLSAEPPKAVPVAAPSQGQSAVVLMLASNDDVSVRTPDRAQQSQPVKHRIARVTTCRCGDPQPAAETDSEQQ